jgi:glyoxylase-like metal-dependent hydrolase (beta-lactamase superfamily II)
MPRVKQLAPDLWMLRGFPPNGINIYLMGDVLVDAGTRHSGRRIFRQLEGRKVAAHALTHAHPDHQGASKEVCERLGIELWCGEHDADAMESGNLGQKSHPLNTLIMKVWGGPPHPVARRLREGDEVAGFRVLDVPGHSPGHVAYWRESDRVLIAGDVLNGQNLMTGIPGLHEPPNAFTTNPAQNRESARRLAALEPSLVVFGHGPPMRDTRKFVDFVNGLAR